MTPAPNGNEGVEISVEGDDDCIRFTSKGYDVFVFGLMQAEFGNMGALVAEATE